MSHGLCCCAQPLPRRLGTGEPGRPAGQRGRHFLQTRGKGARYQQVGGPRHRTHFVHSLRISLLVAYWYMLKIKVAAAIINALHPASSGERNLLSSRTNRDSETGPFPSAELGAERRPTELASGSFCHPFPDALRPPQMPTKSNWPVTRCLTEDTGRCPSSRPTLFLGPPPAFHMVITTSQRHVQGHMCRLAVDAPRAI